MSDKYGVFSNNWVAIEILQGYFATTSWMQNTGKAKNQKYDHIKLKRSETVSTHYVKLFKILSSLLCIALKHLIPYFLQILPAVAKGSISRSQCRLCDLCS